MLGRPSFDAILLDLGLPDSRGLRTFDRALAAIQGLPIVVLTSRAEEADAGCRSRAARRARTT